MKVVNHPDMLYLKMSILGFVDINNAAETDPHILTMYCTGTVHMKVDQPELAWGDPREMALASGPLQ